MANRRNTLNDSTHVILMKQCRKTARSLDALDKGSANLKYRDWGDPPHTNGMSRHVHTWGIYKLCMHLPRESVLYNWHKDE